MSTAPADISMTGETDDRIISESGTEARVAQIAMPALAANRFRLVRIRLLSQNGLTLQVMAERLDGTMTIEDCEEASRVLSAVFDIEDPIDKAYHLEVSSPGIDRPLVRVSDFEAAVGHLVKIETSVLVAGRKRFRGKVVEVTATDLAIEADKIAYGEDPTARIPLDTLADARLVLTDDLVRDALRKDKKLREEAKRRRKTGDDAEPAGDDDNEE
jgi:ribosome maturation factor RimP